MRSAYPTPIMPMDAHDTAFAAYRDRVKAERNDRSRKQAPTVREATRAGGNPDRRTQPLFIRLFRSLWRMP